MGEVDPNGIDAHAPGAKLDAGKLRPHLVLGGFANALEQVVKVGTDGAAKYSDNGWKEVKGGESRYMDALGRHLLALQKGETHDPLSGSPHLAHVAWNALAVLELSRGEKCIRITDPVCADDFCDGCRHNGPGVRMSNPCSKCDASTWKPSRWEATPSDGAEVKRPDFELCKLCVNIASARCEACRPQAGLWPTNFVRYLL